MNIINLTENDLKGIIKESVKKIIKENNFKNPINRAKTAIYLKGKEKGKSFDEIQRDINNYIAKISAINDINKERSVSNMSNHEKKFNNVINNETFNIDFEDLDYYDEYYDNFNKNNRSLDGINNSWNDTDDYIE